MMRDVRLFKIAEKLRRQGKSYSEIGKELGVARSTLSSWFSKKNWSKSVKTLLINKYKQRNAGNLIRMNKLRSLQKLERYEEYRKEAREEYEEIRQNPLFIAGVSLYWGEGEKIEKNGRVAVINTDADMLQVMVHFYRQVLKIPNDKLRAALFIYSDIDQDQAMKYWSRKIRIPKNQFIKTQLLPSRSSLTKRKVTNGICSVYFSSTQVSVKINEWIRLLAFDMRV